jgi:hypothetical protein
MSILTPANVGPAFVLDAEAADLIESDRWEAIARYHAERFAAQAEDDAAFEIELWEEAEAEAARRGCDPEDLVDLWLDQADEPADFDDHDTEHDPRDCQGILDELGMREVPISHLSRCNPPTPYTDEP